MRTFCRFSSRSTLYARINLDYQAAYWYHWPLTCQSSLNPLLMYEGVTTHNQVFSSSTADFLAFWLSALLTDRQTGRKRREFLQVAERPSWLKGINQSIRELKVRARTAVFIANGKDVANVITCNHAQDKLTISVHYINSLNLSPDTLIYGTSLEDDGDINHCEDKPVRYSTCCGQKERAKHSRNGAGRQG